jgi:hypothetical protein
MATKETNENGKNRIAGNGNGHGNGHTNGNGNGNGKQTLHFSNKLVSSIPHGRKGRHNEIVSRILADLEHLAADTAILVPLDGLNGEKMENVRSALNRATRLKEMPVATSTDEKYFYVWRTKTAEPQMKTAVR